MYVRAITSTHTLNLLSTCLGYLGRYPRVGSDPGGKEARREKITNQQRIRFFLVLPTPPPPKRKRDQKKRGDTLAVIQATGWVEISKRKGKEKSKFCKEIPKRGRGEGGEETQRRYARSRHDPSGAAAAATVWVR